ncbi:MAG: hypothetical protein O7E52_22305 [Candidatus Poribacteria bacterium]|nr:hypothetical protein [Candidatus Poribacteria bacterium]
MRYNFRSVVFTLLFTTLLTVTFALNTLARPEFAAQEEKECSFCHIDPAGGGPRNPVGQVFEANYFEFPEDFDPEAIMAEAEEVAQRLTSSVDMRVAYIKTTDVDHEGGAFATCTSCHSSVDSFFMMQGELTINAQASEKLRLTLSNNMGSTLNAFATIDAIPKHLYVKVGQFRLPFGIKQKDHNILVRQGYNLGSNKREVGVEVGGSYKSLFYSAAVFNGGNQTIFNGGFPLGADNNQNKGWVATLGGKAGPLRGGVSYLLDRPGDQRDMTVGVFLTAAHKGLSLEGEFDFGGSFDIGEGIGFSDEDITSKGYYFGAKYRATPKLIVSGRYGLFDPDREVKGDVAQRVTLTARYTFMANAYLELYYWANIENEDRFGEGTNRQLEGTDQLILMSHFWF